MLDPRLYPYPQPLGETTLLGNVGTSHSFHMSRGVTQLVFDNIAAATVQLTATQVLPGMILSSYCTNLSGNVAAVWNSGDITDGVDNTVSFGGAVVTIATAAGGGADDLYAVGTVTVTAPNDSAVTVTFDTDHADYGALDSEGLATALKAGFDAIKADDDPTQIDSIVFTVSGEAAAGKLVATGALVDGAANNAYKFVVAGVGTLAFQHNNKDATDVANTTGVTAGATGNKKIKLPTGYTFDGTNTVATMNAAKEQIAAVAVNGSRFSVIANVGDVALGTS